MCPGWWLASSTRDTVRCVTVRGRRRHQRTGLAVAAAAFLVATGASVTSALALAHPVEPARDTVQVVPPAPVTYSVTDTQAAKNTTCDAWDQASRAIASVGKQRASLADTTGGSSAETEEARAAEKRTTVAQITFLRTRIGPATPPAVRASVADWIATQIDSMHGVNVRDWSATNVATSRGNELVDVIVAECGLR
jgi:hypothetical protein